MWSLLRQSVQNAPLLNESGLHGRQLKTKTFQAWAPFSILHMVMKGFQGSDAPCSIGHTDMAVRTREWLQPLVLSNGPHGHLNACVISLYFFFLFDLKKKCFLSPILQITFKMLVLLIILILQILVHPQNLFLFFLRSKNFFLFNKNLLPFSLMASNFHKFHDF